MASSQTITILKRDLNIYAGADVLAYELKDAAGAVLQSGSLPDDGITTKGGGAGKVQSKALKLTLAQGYHQLRLTSAGSDCIYDVQLAGGRVQWMGGSLSLFDDKLSGSLFFKAPAKAGALTLQTWHKGGAGQTVTLKEAGKTLGSVTLAATHTDYKLTLPAAAPGKDRVLELVIPRMDIYLTSSSVAGYAASGTHLFPAWLVDGFYPLGQTRAVRPGGTSELVLRIKNSAAKTVSFTLMTPQSSGGYTLVLGGGHSGGVTLKPGEEKEVALRVSVPSSAKVGDTKTLKLTALHFDTAGWFATVWVHVVAAAPAKPARKRPFLFYSDAEIAAANKRAADPKTPWAKTIRDKLIASADAWLKLSISVPTGEGAWSGYYVCNNGTSLTYDRASPKKHYCKSEGKYYTGMPYDGCWRTRRYHELARAARTLGLAYRLTGKVAYADRAEWILIGFSRAYLSHRLHDNRWGSSSQTTTPSKSGGRLLSQTLDESAWLIYILAAYDSVADAGYMNQVQKVDIEHNLIRSAVAVIQNYDAGKSNWQAWHNAAIGSAGYTVGEQKWITSALSGKSGFAYHMKNSMLSDGFWYEGSIGYHLYTLSAYRWLALAARHMKQDLYAGGLLKMVRAPLLMALPDLTFPKLNDGGTGRLSSMAGALEAAAALSADKDARAVLRMLYNDQKLDRSSEEALLLGASLGSGSSYSFSPHDFAATGYAILRGGAGASATYVGLDYGPHGSWHGHFDKLQLLFYGAGKLLLPDMGTTAYRLPYHAGFFKQTLSHNTVMLDEKSQAGGDETPRQVKHFTHLRLSTGKASIGLVQAQVGKDVLGGANLATRTVLLAHDHHALDLVNVYAPAAKKTDLVFHGQGPLDITGGLNQGPAGNHAAGWSTSKAGHAYLSAPSLSSGKAKSIIAGQLNTQAPAAFTWSKRLGISHDMDSVEGLSSGVKMVTSDKVQGNGAVLWEADNSGTAQFLTRTFTHDKLELSNYDTLEFWAKFSVAGLKWFGIKVYDLPAFDQAAWRLDQKTPITANKWIKFTVNLNKPDAAWGGAKTAEHIVFRLQGSGAGGAKVSVLLDGLVVKKAGVAEAPLRQGLRMNTFSLTSADASNYIAADAPNNPPVTTHPVVLLRGYGGSTNFLNLLTWFSAAPPTGSVKRPSMGSIKVALPGGGEDLLEFGASGQGLYLHSMAGKHVTDMGFIGKQSFKHALVTVAGARAGDMVLAATDEKNFRYKARKLGPFSITWPAKSTLMTATLDGKRIYPVPGNGGLVLSNLPDGEHTIKILLPSSADGGVTPPDQGQDSGSSTALDSGAGGPATPERGCRCRVGEGPPGPGILFLMILILLRRFRSSLS